MGGTEEMCGESTSIREDVAGSASATSTSRGWGAALILCACGVSVGEHFSVDGPNANGVISCKCVFMLTYAWIFVSRYRYNCSKINDVPLEEIVGHPGRLLWRRTFSALFYWMLVREVLDIFRISVEANMWQ